MLETQAALYIHHNGVGYSIGLVMFEPYGLKGWMCEIEAEASHPYGAIDKVLHLLFVTDSRRLVIGASSKHLFEEIASNFAMFEVLYDGRTFDKIMQNTLFKKVFNVHSLLTPIEHLNLETRPLCAQALALFAHYLKDTDTTAYAHPVFLETTELMELGNNALEQLEMTAIDFRVPSITKLLLTMSTPMGQRLGRHRLFLPIRDSRELNRRLDWIEALNPHALWFKERLEKIGDIELSWWQLQSRRENQVDTFLQPFNMIIEIQSYCLKHKLIHLLSSEMLADGWDVELKNHFQERQWLESQVALIRHTIDWIAQIDVAVASALNAQKYA
ncbi:hypothetical protein, partial [Sulfuricurvum sp.]|uniref:hypothetical protein n=1 Tax=Sulfuricurvum sp. TaxID=2025608 RepID=UPI003BB1E39B